MISGLGPKAPRGVNAPRESDRWAGLRGLLRYRLLLAAVALPVGLQASPDAPARSPWVLVVALLAVGAASGLFALGLAARRGARVQLYANLAFDAALVTALAAWSGGQGSQFVMFYLLVALLGGFVASLPGGFAAAGLACAGYLALPALAAFAEGAGGSPAVEPVTRPAWFLIFLCTVGALTGLLGQRHDLARERLAETRRELLRTRLDTDQILQHLTTGVLTVDAEGRVVFLNLAAQQVLELEAAAVHGRPCGEALPQRLAPLRDPLMRTVRTARPETRVEMELERSDGSRLPVGCSTNVLYAQGQANGVVAVFQDLSEVREMERRALRAETLAQVGKLSAGIAHEIRNGLKPISGSVEYLQRELKLEGESERLMALIGRECDRLNRFVSDLLSYSRERELVPEAIELGSALREVCELLRRDPRCGPGVAVAAEGDLRPILVAGDREQLRQVWLNLATNALEAMAGRGRLELRWGSTPRGEAWVEFIDSGAGIEAGDLLRAGEPFFTTKQGGTGLGLAIARRIVERHGGRLDLDSHPDRGTTARVTLPCERAHQALAA